ncbi:GNAT family N-acetyltransferase [Nocardia sp. NBC_01327]|uniref:GNAT family N-acetyltransferase n=1 Tax=Nocardia sp. NBC_01327 TaxID=2903593 RepID=UPI002E12DCB5|nr:GNAT family N-acetyltransferase [Nocardia sp. NBC_01327]
MDAGGEVIEAILDRDGNPLGYFERDERGGRPWADELCCAAEVSPGAAAAAIVRSLAGWGATVAGGFGSDLVDAGARRLRTFFTYTLSLSPPIPEPRLPSGLQILPAGQFPPEALYEALLAAYPPGHPDHDDDAPASLDGLYDGTLMGPLHPCSAVAWDGRRVVAAVLVQDAEGKPPLAGPWISEAFRHPGPDYAGLGALLLHCVTARASDAGLTALGLSVTDGNPAQAVYERLGFTRTARWTDLEFPNA